MAAEVLGDLCSKLRSLKYSVDKGNSAAFQAIDDLQDIKNLLSYFSGKESDFDFVVSHFIAKTDDALLGILYRFLPSPSVSSTLALSEVLQENVKPFCQYVSQFFRV
ncbi:hypothetical protein D918_09754 [Trichuris suis]|nr:hypothetical protein D918_09754 [Trichuris suis]